MISSLPLGSEQLEEVYGAVSSSSGDGYDEEYTMRKLFESPGSGVGGTKAEITGVPLRDMIAQYLQNNPPSPTKAGAADVQRWLDELSSSEMQIYWPYSENWDGETFPIVTFAPELDSDCNYGYEVSFGQDGARVVDSVYVDEAIARQRPVWVINKNTDEGYTPLKLLEIKEGGAATSSVRSVMPDQIGHPLFQQIAGQAGNDVERAGNDVERAGNDGGSTSRRLYLKSICALRNYDSWFAGASEFFIKCGSLDGIKASSSDELLKFYPQLNDMVIVVKRSEVNTVKPVGTMLLGDLTDQIDKVAFLMTEDDGGTRTGWKTQVSAKIGSKTYGVDIEIPYRSRDDIVWRGQISAEYFRQGTVTSRFGDVRLTFALN